LFDGINFILLLTKNGEAFDDTVEDGDGIRDDSGAIHLNGEVFTRDQEFNEC
jgi:hypothetical protein